MKQFFSNSIRLILVSTVIIFLFSGCFIFKPCDCPTKGGFSSEKNDDQKEPAEFYSRVTNEFTATM